MAPKLLWITIIHVLSWDLIYSVSESVGILDVNENGEYASLRDRVRYTTHICERMKNSPPVIDHNNYEHLSDSDGVDNFDNLKLAKDSSEPLRALKKRYAINSRCSNRPAQENNEPNKPDSISSEWQMKSTPENDAGGDLRDYLMVHKSKVVDLRKFDINPQKVVYQEPLYTTLPLLQKGNLIGNSPKHPLLQLNLQDKTNKIKSLISSPQHKVGEIIPSKLFDESLPNKLAQPSLALPFPYKFIKYPEINPSMRPTEVHNNVDTAALMTDNDKQSNPLKPSPLSPLSPQIPNNNFNQKGLINENKPFLSLPPIQFNKPKPIDLSYDKRVPPIAYRPTPSQLIQTPVIKPLVLPIFAQKGVSIPSANQRPQSNIASSSQYPKVANNGIAESTSQPTLVEKDVSISLPHKKQHELVDLSSPTQFIQTSDVESANRPITIIEKKVSIYFPHKKHQELIDLSPPKQFIKTSDTETVHKPIAIEKEVSMSAPNEQKEPIVDLPQQAPQLIKTPDKESIYQETPEQTIVSVNEPYEQKQSMISLPSLPQITETFNSESTSQAMLIEKEVAMSTPNGQQQPMINLSPPPQLPQIKIQKEISIPLPYQQKNVGSPLKLIKPFNAELISQSISQQKNALYEQQQPIILPSPPPLTKTTTSNYA